MTGPVGIEIEEAEGADLGRIEAGHAQTCDRCGGASYTGARCTRCTFASRPSPPWPVGRDTSEAPEPSEAVVAPAVQDPEFVCPEFCDHPEPKPVMDLAGEAMRFGWTVMRRHSRGGVMGGQGKQLAVADIWSVRFQRPGWAGYAVRRGSLWESIWVAGSTLSPFGLLSLAGLKVWLANPEQGPEWYAEIKRLDAMSALATKIVKCPGPEKCTLDLVAKAFVPFGVPVVAAEHTHRANGDIKIKTSRKEKVSGA